MGLGRFAALSDACLLRLRSCLHCLLRSGSWLHRLTRSGSWLHVVTRLRRFAQLVVTPGAQLMRLSSWLHHLLFLGGSVLRDRLFVWQ